VLIVYIRVSRRSRVTRDYQQLDRNGDIFVGDPGEKTLEEQVLLEETILEIVGDDDDIELDEEIEI
jgi:hypothetical protein